jgi:hypothetical protein
MGSLALAEPRPGSTAEQYATALSNGALGGFSEAAPRAFGSVAARVLTGSSGEAVFVWIDRTGIAGVLLTSTPPRP